MYHQRYFFTCTIQALALGADGVGIGKPYLYGLCAGGSEGVIRVMDILKTEVEGAMGLLGDQKWCGSKI